MKLIINSLNKFEEQITSKVYFYNVIMTSHDNEDVVDILRPLNDQEFNELLELYKQKYESNRFQYLLLYTQHKWNRKLYELNVNDNQRWISFRKIFYTHRKGDFRKYGTYVCLHQDLKQSVTFHSWEPNLSELLECLNKTKLIHWKRGPLLINVADVYSQAVKEIAIAQGTTIQRARKCYGFTLKHERTLELHVPSLPIGYKLTNLQESDADLIYKFWVNNKEASLDYIKGFIQMKKAIGVVEESTNNLIGWIFQNEFSGLGILQVLPSAQRKGFGIFLAISMSKLIAESEVVDLSAWALVENIKSETLLQKVGYKKSVLYEWIQLNEIEN